MRPVGASRLAVVAALAALAAACARHVVLDPESAAALDNKVWTIESEPDAGAAPRPSTPAHRAPAPGGERDAASGAVR